MRAVALITLLSGLAVAVPASAGTVSYTDGKGTWQPTKCTVPASPMASSTNSESAANDLNARMTMHNQYVAATQAYLTCISQEAQTDADGVSQAITRAAQAAIQQTQAKVVESAATLNNR